MFGCGGVMRATFRWRAAVSARAAAPTLQLQWIGLANEDGDVSASTVSGGTMTDQRPPLVELMALTTGYQRSRALMAAAEFGIADLLRDGPRSVEQLAQATGTHAPTLYRLLRALAAVGVFDEQQDQRFALTPMSEFLRSDAAMPYGNLARFFGRDYQWAAWGALPHSVRTGENAAKHVLGVDVWEYRKQHPQENAIFNDAMLAVSLSSAGLEVGAYDFGRSQTVADIGGGTGALLTVMLRKYPQVRGVLFDQPHVVADAGPVLEAAGVADRVTIEGGSFFEKVPAGAETYVLRRILHDWLDDEAIAILRCCRAAMSSIARVVVLESVIGPPNEDAFSKFFDLLMLVSAGGRERTEAQWRSLFEASGLRLESVTPASPNSYAIVGAPV
jgi:hypothetical protein